MNRPGQTADAVMKAVPWLKSENARGADIYIRPEDRRYVLMDDVRPDTIERLKADGIAPAAVLETSRGNLAAWIRIAPQEAPEPSPEAATAIAKGLAARYGADPAAADYAHVSRLPGFTNRKPSRQVDGKPPFVLLREATGRVARAGLDLIDQARVYIERRARQTAISNAPDSVPAADRDGDPAAAYRAAIRRHIGGKAVDWSQADFRAAQDMALSGWSRKQIADAIKEASPHVIQRKGHAVAGYADRTAQKAVSSDLVQQELLRRAEAVRTREKAAQEHLQRMREQEAREAREAARYNGPRPR